MAGAINRIPQGFLSLLDLKTQGQNAHTLSDTLIPVVECLDFYLAAQRQVVTAQAAASIGAVSAAALTPAAGEIWIVRQFCVFSVADLPAAATFEIVAGYVPLTTGTFIGLGSNSGTKTVAQRVMSVFSDPFILQPGDQLGYWGTVFTGAPGNVRLTASISRLAF